MVQSSWYEFPISGQQYLWRQAVYRGRSGIFDPGGGKFAAGKRISRDEGTTVCLRCPGTIGQWLCSLRLCSELGCIHGRRRQRFGGVLVGRGVCVVYTGTHDNDTVLGWMQSANPDDVALAKEYFHIIEGSQSVWEWIRGAFSSVADTAIIPMQDYLQLGSSARINTPSTLGGLNWCWRMENGSCTASLAQKIASLTQCYGRTPSP